MSKLLLIASLSTGIGIAQAPVARIQDVRSIYVDSLGRDEGADTIRSKIITQLVKSGRFEVAIAPDNADAVLTGSGSLTKTYSSDANGSGDTSYHASAGVQLVVGGKIIWAEDINNRYGWNPYKGKSASGNLAERIVKALLEADSPTPTKQKKHS